jgi:hypothetical protein
MTHLKPFLAVVTLVVTLGSYLALAQAPAQGQRQGGPPPQQPMNFFVTSVGVGRGADLGGLAGADAHCQKLGAAAGRGNVKWMAYLSTQGPNAVNARDRIGAGPWFNAQGRAVAANLDELHGDTLPMARQGNRVNKNTALTEKGEIVNGSGDMPNQHDMLTGSTTDGRAYSDGMDHTCNNWTSGADGMGTAQLGHHDRIGNASGSWNSAHASRGCSQPNLVQTGGAGQFYCFALGN